MVHYGWIILASVVSGSAGFLIATFCDAAHNGDHPQELLQAYQDGFEVGQGKPGCLVEAVNPLPNKSLKEGRLSTEQEAMVFHPAIPLRQLSPEAIAQGRAAAKRLSEKFASDRGKAAPGSTLADESYSCCGVKPMTQELILAQNVREMDVETEG